MSGDSRVEGSWVEPSSHRTFGYRCWQAREARALLVLLHGFGEHGGRYELFARELAEQGITVAAPDLWAHGRSGGVRGDLGAIADCARQLQQMTAEVFLPQARQTRYTLFGHSFGGLVSILWALDAPTPLHRLILQAPLLEVGFPIPRWKHDAAACLARVWPAWSLNMDLDLSMLSHDPAVKQAYLADSLTHRAMSARTYRSLQRAEEDAFARAPTLRVPVLFLCGTDDRIISVERAQQWYDRVACPKRRVLFEGAYHELHHEAVRETVLRSVRDWTLAGLILLALAGRAWAEGDARDEPSATDWPTAISRLQQEVYERPGFLQPRQQLAIAQNNYGVELSSQGQWEQAVQHLQEAIRLDDSNRQFKDNLSRIYLKEADAAYQHHEINEASDALDHAIELAPDLAQAYVLRGMIEYNRQRLKEAKAAWQRALELDPNQPEIAKRLAQVAKELPVESKFERLSQAYFDLRYEEQLERPAGFDVQEALLQARRDVGSDFSCWPQHKIVVLIYSAESFRALRRDTPEWIAGQFDGKIRVPLPDVQLDPASVRQIVYHEYTHAVIQDLAGGQCPTWLNEGLAEYEGQTQKARGLDHLAEAFRSGGLVPLATLSDQFAYTLPVEAVALGYEQSYSVVAYLVDRYAFWRIRRLLRFLSEGHALDEALAGELRVKPARLEADWLEWLPTLLDKSSSANGR